MELVSNKLQPRLGEGFGDESFHTVRTIDAPEACALLTGIASGMFGRTGLEERYDQALVEGSGGAQNLIQERGADLHLTIDRELQQFVYQRLEQGGFRGAAVVSGPQGELLAMVSLPGIDGNRLNGNDKVYGEELSQTEGAYLHRAWRTEYTPGSTFKLVSSAAILSAGLHKEPFYETGAVQIGGFTIRNATQKGVDTYLELTDALEYSSNTYFAAKISELGQESFQQTLDDFRIGTDIVCDFGTLHSSVNLQRQSVGSLAQAAFGQGVSLTPVHLNAITASIATGELMRPYMVNYIQNPDGQVIDRADPRVLSRPVQKREQAIIRQGMLQAAEAVGLATCSAGGMEYSVALKTGTAEYEQADGLHHHALITSFSPAEDGRPMQYAITLLETDSAHYGLDLAPALRDIYVFLYSNRSSGLCN